MNESGTQARVTKHLKKVAVTVAIESNVRVTEDAVQLIFKQVQQELPDIARKLKHDKEAKYYYISNDAASTDDEVMFRIGEESPGVLLAWGPSVPEDRVQEIVRRTLSIVIEQAPLLVSGIEFIDCRHAYEATVKANHYNVIHKAFFSGGSAAPIFTDEKRLDNDATFWGLVDDDRIAFVRIVGLTTADEVKKQKFEEREFRVTVGVGQRSGIDYDKIVDAVLKNYGIASRFVRDSVEPHVILQLEKAIESVKQSRTEKESNVPGDAGEARESI